MKKKTLICSLFFLLLMNISIQSQSVTNGFYNTFYRGIIDNGRQHDYSYFNNLNMNVWFHYTNWWVNGEQSLNWGWTDYEPNDILTNDVNLYKNSIINVLADNNTHQMRTISDRIKLAYLMLGQRCDYQCEVAAKTDQYYDFYAFENHSSYDSDYPETGHGADGHIVRYCPLYPNGGGDLIPNPPHEVVSGLRANRQQVCNWSWYYNDSRHNFIVKPSIRIPTGLPENNPDLEVCRIRVFDWNGPNVPNAVPIKDVIIKAGYFKPESGTYNGDYIEEYKDNHNPVNITIVNTNNFNKFNPNNESWIDGTCNVDYIVDWLGHCDMWIDYVRVDDNIADQLFKGYYTDPNHPENEWIRREVQEIAMASGLGNNVLKFYFDEEIFMEHVPCSKYVNQKIKEYSGNTLSVMCDLNVAEFYNCHRRYVWTNVPPITADYVKHTLIDEIGLDEIYTFSYPMHGYIQNTPLVDRMGQPLYDPSYIPSTLGDYNFSEGRLAMGITPDAYDDWLQGYLDNGWPDSRNFLGSMKLADATSKLCNIPFVNIVQGHLIASRQPSGSYYTEREPTNEELKVLSYVPITYGARGQLYYSWGGSGTMGNINYFERGFVGGNGQFNFDELRHENVYGELANLNSSKILTVGEINAKLNAWSSYLMNFTNPNRHSYIYRTERNDLLENTYFDELYTYKIGYPPINCWGDFPQNDVPPQGSIGECKQDRYLQVAVFKKPPYLGHNELYFMIVNRRCSPFLNDQSEINNGGRRFVRVKFDINHPEMNAANTWQITKVGNDAWSQTFSKTFGAAVDLDDWFLPGEGKLYKMVPVLRSGGTLLADEVIPGTEEFTCEDTVWTNGYNLTIQNGAKIHFSDSAKFVVEGGTFTMGNPNQSGQDITMDAAPNGSWKGFEFHGANVGIYNTTFSGLANDSISMLTFIDCPLISLKSNAFNTGTGNNKGCVDINYTDPWQAMSNAYIGYNSFTTGDADIPAVKVMAYSGFTTPVIIEENNFTGTTTALFMNNIQGGAIKSIHLLITDVLLQHFHHQ